MSSACVLWRDAICTLRRGGFLTAGADFSVRFSARLWRISDVTSTQRQGAICENRVTIPVTGIQRAQGTFYNARIAAQYTSGARISISQGQRHSDISRHDMTS